MALFFACYPAIQDYICDMLRLQNSLGPVNFITGIADGLLLPFAICIVAYPALNFSLRGIIATGAISSVAGAIVFGLARYYGEKAEIHHHHPAIAEADMAKEMSLLHAIDIDQELTEDMQLKMEQERELWLQEIKKHDMGWEVYDHRRAVRSSFQTAIGFLSAGMLVTLSFCIVKITTGLWFLPLLVTAFSITFFGWMKGRITGKPPAKMALAHLLKALLVSICAMLIALLIYKEKNPGL